MAESPGMAAANGDARRGDTLCVLLRRWARTCRLCLQGCLHDRDVPSWCPGHAEMVSLFVGEESATSESALPAQTLSSARYCVGIRMLIARHTAE